MVAHLNAAASSWWDWMGPLMLQVAVLVLLVGAVDLLLLRRRVWPQVRYALWLLVLVKLALPPTLSLSSSLTGHGHRMIRQAVALPMNAGEAEPGTEGSASGAASGTASVNTRMPGSGEPVWMASPGSGGEPVGSGHGLSSPGAGNGALSDTGAVSLSWKSHAMLAWLAGAAGLMLWLGLRLRRLARIDALAPDSEELPLWLRRALTEAAQALNLRRLPRIAVSDQVHSPAVFGVPRPVLLLPAAGPGRVSPKDARYVLLHELAHIKRGDLWVHMIGLVLQVVYWFNPLLWLVRRQLQHLRELCCDATVAAILRDQTCEYRRTILQVARRMVAGSPGPGLGLLCLIEDSHRLLVRLRWLEKPTWKCRTLTRATATASVVFMCACVLPMAEPAGKEDPAPKEKAGGWPGGRLVRMSGVASTLPGSWPGFRGPDRDGVARDAGDLARSWGENGPRVVWSRDVGQGHAGAVIHRGRVFLADYDERQDEEVIRCLSLDDGRDIWQYRHPSAIQPNHGITRAVPAVTDQRLVTVGPTGRVTCLAPETGEVRWNLDLTGQIGGVIPPWYSGQCPLVEHDTLVLAVGGDSLLAGIDCDTGQIRWQSGNPRRWKPTHSSVTPLEFGGRRQYAYCGSGGVVGVDAEDGTTLWEFRDWRVPVANVPSPLVVGPGRIFLCGGYGKGSVMLQLRREADRFVAVEEFRLPEDVFGAHVHTPILFEGHIYGIRMDGRLACLDLLGNVKWTSNDRTFGLGSYLIADRGVYVMDDHAALTLVEATPDDYLEQAYAELFSGEDAWATAAMASGRLVLRDLRRMVCVDLARERPAVAGRTTLRIRTDNSRFKEGQKPVLLADFSQDRDGTAHELAFLQENWAIELDGQWYRATAPDPGGAIETRTLEPGGELRDIRVPLLDTFRSSTGSRLEFPPGRHSVRVRFTLDPPVESADRRPVPLELLSNDVELTVIPYPLALLIPDDSLPKPYWEQGVSLEPAQLREMAGDLRDLEPAFRACLLALANKDIDALVDLYDPEHVALNSGDRDVLGREEMRTRVERIVAEKPDEYRAVCARLQNNVHQAVAKSTSESDGRLERIELEYEGWSWTFRNGSSGWKLIADHGPAETIEAAVGSARSVLFVVPQGSFQPQTGAELLAELNSQLPFDIPEEHFMAKARARDIAGWAVVANDQQKDAVKRALKESSNLRLLQVEALTPAFEAILRQSGKLLPAKREETTGDKQAELRRDLTAMAELIESGDWRGMIDEFVVDALKEEAEEGLKQEDNRRITVAVLRELSTQKAEFSEDGRSAVVRLNGDDIRIEWRMEKAGGRWRLAGSL